MHNWVSIRKNSNNETADGYAVTAKVSGEK